MKTVIASLIVLLASSMAQARVIVHAINDNPRYPYETDTTIWSFEIDNGVFRARLCKNSTTPAEEARPSGCNLAPNSKDFFYSADEARGMLNIDMEQGIDANDLDPAEAAILVTARNPKIEHPYGASVIAVSPEIHEKSLKIVQAIIDNWMTDMEGPEVKRTLNQSSDNNTIAFRLTFGGTQDLLSHPTIKEQERQQEEQHRLLNQEIQHVLDDTARICKGNLDPNDRSAMRFCGLGGNSLTIGEDENRRQ